MRRIATEDDFRRLADGGSGFILNVNGRSTRVHHAACLHLTAFTNVHAEFTRKPKFFADDSEELANYAKAQPGLRLVPCKTCGATAPAGSARARR
jgi:hypothetical protein